MATAVLFACVAGGNFETNVLRTLEAYNPLTNQWRNRTAMPTARAHLALARINAKLLAAGGENVSRSLSVLESYDPGTNV